MSLYQRPAIRRLAGLVLLACAVRGFLQADAGSHSVSDTLFAVAPLWGVCGLAWWWIRRLGSGASADPDKKN